MSPNTLTHLTHRLFGLSIRTLVLSVGVLILLASAGKVTVDLAARLFYEVRGPYTWDSPVYWAIGRGILNGLLPYRDLFDTKPPGIFFVSAASLLLTGGFGLTAILQTVVIAGFPLIFAIFAYRQARHLNTADRWVLVLFAWVLGTVIGLYTAERGGEFQVESFGAFFGALYVATIAQHEQQMSLKWVACATFFLLLSIGMKEPFFLSAIASSFIVCSTLRSWTRAFLIPSLIAAVAGVTVLFTLGYLGPYVTFHLREIFFHHITMAGSPWQRGLVFARVLQDLDAYAQYLAATILTLFFSFIWFRLHQWQSVPAKLGGLLATGVCAYLVVLAVGIGGEFYNHHFVFAVPAYVALGLVFLCTVGECEGSAVTRTFFIVGSAFMVVTAFQQPQFDYAARLQYLRDAAMPAVKAAHQIDAVLESCHISRYLFLGGNGPQPFGYTTHSPLGPIFNQHPQFFDASETVFRQKFLDALRSASIIVLDHLQVNDLTAQTETYIAQHFSQKPWPCAGIAVDTAPYQFLYRNL